MKKKNRWLKRTLIFTTAAAAAAVLLFVTIDQVPPKNDTNIVYAMEKAMKEIEAYHGVIEVSEINELGETMTQSKREVWADKNGNYYMIDLEGTNTGLITANNGELKWQIRPEEEVAYLLAAFPDANRFTFELGNEINDVANAQTVKIIGLEKISNRETTKLEITPDGGAAYYLWVDKETELPLQRQSAMQNALQVKAAYSSIEFIGEIPQEMLIYMLPEGYEEVNTASEQVVTTLEESADIAGFLPVLPGIIPDGYIMDKITIDKNRNAVKLYYTVQGQSETVLLTQLQTREELSPDSMAILGTVNGSLLLSPEGIVGEYPIAYENIAIIENNGVDSIAEITADNSMAKYVYMKRLVRQDDSGIWTVVGYDSVQQ